MKGKYKDILRIAYSMIAPGERCIVSKVIEESVKDVLSKKYGENWHTHSERFYDIFEQLRKDFNKEAYKEDISYVYLMYYMLLNIPKVQLVVLQLMERKRLNKRIRILDVGSAVGTTAVACLDLISLLDHICNLHGQERLFEEVVIDSIEASESNIKVFNEHMVCYRDRLQTGSDIDYVTVNAPVQGDITNLEVEGTYDLIIVSNMLNEIAYAERLKVVTCLQEHLNSDSEMIIIEPASKNASKYLQELKFKIVEKEQLRVIGPCGNHAHCNGCWTFRKAHMNSCELVHFIDERYKQYNESKYTEFYNERLKWTYVILSNDKNAKSLHTFKEGCKTVWIIKNREVKNTYGHSYEVCDEMGSRLLLTHSQGNLDYYDYGDQLLIEGAAIRDTHMELNEQSKVQNVFKHSDKCYPIYSNIEEKDVSFFLNRLWGFSAFRDGQYEIIKQALTKQDTLGILPTGAGKSICYQLPAMLGNGVSLIISPLKSLIRDQVNNLHDIGFEFVDYIDSSRTPKEKNLILNRFKSGNLKMLYVSPERLQMYEFQQEIINMIKYFPIDYFIIDEAHCASEWGHDFRPSYLKLKDIVKTIQETQNSCSILAVTATASPKVREDILELFAINPAQVVASSSLDRSELSLEVMDLEQEQHKDDYLKEYLVKHIPSLFQNENIGELHKEGAGIIFTVYANPTGESTKSFGTPYICDIVKSNAIDGKVYHSKLTDEERGKVQDAFKKNEFPLLVSTKGFGMGIDKPNIRYIIHMCYPNSLEAYYQEAGRAGRDRAHAHSIIIARKRQRACAEDNKDINQYEPACIKKWRCHYTNALKCDYGMQAKFISDEYKSYTEMISKIRSFYYNDVRPAYNRRQSRYTGKEALKCAFWVDEKNSSEYQKYMFYLQKYGPIEDYHIMKYADNKVRLGITFEVELEDEIIEKAIEKTANRLQIFKKQKYIMLNNMWEYVSNNKKCRRQYLMDYFQDSTDYGTDGCGFCDVEGIKNEHAIAAISTLKREELHKDVMSYFTATVESFEGLNELLKRIDEEKAAESIKIRALKHLEDYTEHMGAHYIASMITLKADIQNSFARNQAYQVIEYMYNKGDFRLMLNGLKNYYQLDESLAIQILINIKGLIHESEKVEELIDMTDDEEIKNIIYKLHIREQLFKLSRG